MELRYTLMDPTKNMTVLVETAMDRALYAPAARELLSAIPGAEQAGWLETPASARAWSRLQMMGGEFCGNAAMAAASLLASRRGLADGEAADVPLEVSGAEGVLTCRVRRAGDRFLGTVAMPLPERISRLAFPLRGGSVLLDVVELPGIAHILAPAEQVSREEAERLIRDWGAGFAAEAVGVLLTKGDEIAPLVLVKPTDSLVWERGCGSGSAAVGAWRASRADGEAVTRARQPGGSITVRSERRGGRIVSLSITGEVRAAGEGTVRVLEG